ncbi:MAG: apolipoprotein N-acyltransferase, partial [Candidatus Omnitrophica bacterium]|nr:apolipoprotein N-acyltransferase [Candidatus Omnitrophota bacterium]
FYFSFLFYWIGFVSVIGLVGLVLYLSLYIGVFGLAAAWWLNRKYEIPLRDKKTANKIKIKKSLSNFLPSAVVLSCLWIILEYIRSHFPVLGFGWALLGYSQTSNLFLIQIARITGAYGVSFIVMVFNVTVFYLVCWLRLFGVSSSEKEDKNYYKTKFYFSAGLGASLWLVYLSYGLFILNKPINRQDHIVRIGVVQGNIPQEVKWDDESQPLIMQKYSLLSQLALVQSPDIIIWPETSVPDYIEEGGWAYEAVSELARQTKTPFLVGAPYLEKEGKARSGHLFNSAFLFSAQGRLVSRYDKLCLVPFGEYLPFADKVRFLEKYIKIINEVGDFKPGNEYTLLPVNQKSLGVLICFEDIFTDLVREFVNKGAEILVNITNDAWFKYSPAPYQHMNASVFRAVENNRSVVRAANTGISCFIDPHGRVYSVLKKSKGVSPDNNKKTRWPGLFISGYLVEDVIFTQEKTFYTQHGDIFVLICLIIILF